ncbi:hypothetical protein C8Q74DRAFT_955093 [Fomes fomentarius]|nr:hypothetical protein C8Q74DRAFT_955093 [Fomes fomentarius]
MESHTHSKPTLIWSRLKTRLATSMKYQSPSMSDLSQLRGIVHLTLDNVPSRRLESVQYDLPNLPDLVSLRIVMEPSHPNVSHRVDRLWPTLILESGELRSLRYLEIEDRFDPYSPEYNELSTFDANFDKLGLICPELTTLVWHPSHYSHRLAKDDTDSQFRQSLVQYTNAVFSLWPMLRRFERPKLESLSVQENVEWVAFRRGEDGSIVDAS